MAYLLRGMLRISIEMVAFSIEYSTKKAAISIEIRYTRHQIHQFTTNMWSTLWHIHCRRRYSPLAEAAPQLLEGDVLLATAKSHRCDFPLFFCCLSTDVGLFYAQHTSEKRQHSTGMHSELQYKCQLVLRQGPEFIRNRTKHSGRTHLFLNFH